ncbi:MAG: hypothetical protein JW751_24865 [Polyangiaceae bacterium]|nr:hypothetical protein [Polyangiaceae bacterium]
MTGDDVPVQSLRGGSPFARAIAGSALATALVLGPARLAAAEGAADSESEGESSLVGPERPRGWTSSLSLLEEYRLRRASRALTAQGPLGEAAAVDDQLDHRLRLHSDAQVDGVNDHFLALFSGALWWDMDGPETEGNTDLFASQHDDSRVWVAPYALSAQWRDAGVLDHARLGRQDSEHGLPLTFDGVSLGLRPFGPRLLLFGFGGQTVHFFETMPGLLEDWVASVGAVLRPSPALQFELDTRLVQERFDDSVEANGSDLTTLSYGLAASTRTELVTAKAQVRGLDEQLSHAGAAMQLYLPAYGFGVDTRLFSQLVTLGEVAESENPYFSLLGPSLPHVRYRFEAFKDQEFGDAALWTNLLGWRGRVVVGHDETPFNRNVGVVYLHSRVDDLILPGLFFGATVEWNYVSSSPGQPWLVALGGSAGYDGRRIMTEVGTYYQRFKINYYQRAEELHHARTVYGSIGYRMMSWLELRGRYELEIVDRYLESFSFSARQYF